MKSPTTHHQRTSKFWTWRTTTTAAMPCGPIAQAFLAIFVALLMILCTSSPYQDNSCWLSGPFVQATSNSSGDNRRESPSLLDSTPATNHTHHHNNNKPTATTATVPTSQQHTLQDTNTNSTGEQQPQEQQQQQHRLSCQPGEQRQFSYESSTRVWGSTEQQVRLRATLRLKCMEPPTNTTLKYLAEIVSLTPNFVHQNEIVGQKLQQATVQVANGGKRPAFKQNGAGSLTYPTVYSTDQTNLKAEPLLEEVGQAATRAGRSLSGWFSKAWLSVRDFFGNIFTTTERSSVSRDQAFKESGLDIMGQCKAPSSSSKGRHPAGLPFDESVFEDLGPEYYIGASLDGSMGAGSNGLGGYFEHSTGDHTTSDTLGQPPSSSAGRTPLRPTTGAATADDEQDELSMSLSFFDDPVLAGRASTGSSGTGSSRTKRAAGHHSSKSTRSAMLGGSGSSGDSSTSNDYNKLIRIPFVFVQSRAGKIIEIRFSGDELDLSVKNFKRHLCDLFATNLDWNRTSQNEVSPIGKHQTKYQLDSSANSIDSIKESALKLATNNNDEERSNKQQLVRVLATMVGTNDRSLVKDVGAADGNGTNKTLVDLDDDDDDGHVNDHEHDQDYLDPTVPAADDGRRNSTKRGPGGAIAVLRTINTTSSIQLSSKMFAPDIDRIQVRVKQVQQINGGRLVGTAGQLSMSLMQMQQQQQSSSGGAGSGRSKRETATTTNSYDDEQSKSHEQVDDISDLLRVSTSFSMQLVPIPRNPDGSIDDETPSKSTGRSATSRRWQRSVSNGSPEPKGHHNRKKARKSAALVRQPPSDPQELQRVLQEWRKQEVRLQLSPSNLVAENNGQQESQQTRLDILRDQIRQRLNEEYVTNRIRRSLTQQQQQLAAAAAVSSGPLVTPSQQQARGGDGQDSQTSDSEPSSSSAPKSSGAGGDLGLGLTQLVIGSGVTTKRKGSIYSTIEEAMELETNLVSDQNDPMAISKLLRETIRMDKLKQHCKSSIPSIEELGDADSSHYHRKRVSGVSKLQIERRLPFGFKATSDYYDDDATSDNADDDDLAEDQREHKSRSHELREDTTSTANRAAAKKSKRRLKTRSLVDQFERQNDKRLEQCQNVLQLMLKLNDRQAIELVIDLIDECNQRLLAAAKREELGYGPMSKLYRRLRKRFIELLVHTSRPSDSLMDKLLARLYYPKMSLESTNNNNNGGKYQHRSSSSHNQGTGSRGSPPHQHTTPEPAEFVYVNQRATKDGGTKYNKSLLKDEDDFNNNDGAALLVMTITSLAAKSSVSRTKRVELTERLLQSLKGTTCSLFNTPDLDIIESMANFQEPLDEIVGRILQLARRCKQHDQYVVACIHGLSGQLQHSGTQRFLIDLLKSQNSSCTIKSEIVLTLIGAQLANDLKQFTSSPLSVGSGQEQRASNNNSNNQSSAHGSTRPTATSTASQWPNSGLNKVDETLLELLDGTERQREPDRRCLKQLVGYYLSKKHQTVQSSGSGAAGSSGSGPNSSGSGGKQQRSGRSHNQQQQQHSRHLNQLDQAAAARGGAPRRHGKRAVMNEQNFWDEAQCKRWSVPADGQFDLSTIFGPAANQSNFYTAQSPPSPNHHDLIDEIDDNSIITALMSSHNNNNNKSSARSGRRNQKLIERELDANSNSSTSSTSSSSGSAGGGASSTMAGGGGGHTAGGQSSSQATNTYLRRRHKCVASKDFGPKSAQANLKAEIVNDLIGSMDENKFLARFRLSTNFLGNRIDVGRMYLWHQRRTTRAYANILGRSIWDSSHGCKDKAPNQVLYMPLFDFNLWLVKVSVGLRLNAEMGFFPNCDQQQQKATSNTTSSAISNEGDHLPSARVELKQSSSGHNDELQLYPSITLKAAGEATARLVVARAGMSLASQYSYQGDIRVSRQPESCMSVYSSHQPMNITFSSWFQLWDNDCHFWGSRGRAEPQAIKWRLMARKPTVWLEDECLAAGLTVPGRSNSTMANDQKTPTDRTAGAATPLSARTIATANRIDP